MVYCKTNFYSVNFTIFLKFYLMASMAVSCGFLDCDAAATYVSRSARGLQSQLPGGKDDMS
jgi:hypothetical protein